jgi:hypothetical protein
MKELDLLRSETARNTAMIAELTRVLRSTIQQWFTLENLMERWALGRDTTIAVLREHGGYTPQRGVPIRVPLESVLKIDEALNNQQGPKVSQGRQTTGTRRVEGSLPHPPGN